MDLFLIIIHIIIYKKIVFCEINFFLMNKLLEFFKIINLFKFIYFLIKIIILIIFIIKVVKIFNI